MHSYQSKPIEIDSLKHESANVPILKKPNPVVPVARRAELTPVVDFPVPCDKSFFPVNESAACSTSLSYASFGSRVGAAIIDFIILQVASSFIEALFLPVLFGNLNGQTIVVAMVGPLILTSLFALFYSVYLESSSWQATPGKKLVGIKVVDLEGQRVTFGRASLRNLAKSLSMITMCIGYLMPLWDSKRQALHDKVTRCLVVQDN